jgi:light-regulated signal transduction histidine kinase (bacteriophytochrome)
MTEQYKKDYAEFIDLAAHDLDAPLRKLTVLVDRLTQKIGKDLDKDAQGYVQRINSSIAGMRSMIDSLMKYSHLNAATLNIESCPMEAIVEEAWWELKRVVNDTGATIHKQSALPELEGDREQYRMLFLQLFDNALRFRKADQAPKVQVYASKLTKEEKTVLGVNDSTEWYQFTVEDNGIGFQQPDAEKIFKPFVQLHGKSAFQGNGIGLALSKRIIDNLEGTIFAKSTPDAGTRIIFILPQTIN